MKIYEFLVRSRSYDSFSRFLLLCLFFISFLSLKNFPGSLLKWSKLIPIASDES